VTDPLHPASTTTEAAIAARTTAVLRFVATLNLSLEVPPA
jgi:hypothetical protein